MNLTLGTGSTNLKILLVCNRYPPDDAGGYPQLCFDVVQGLKARGHQILVLTTILQKPNDHDEEAILRILMPEAEYVSGMPVIVQQWDLPKRLQHNERCLLEAVSYVDPDIILFWPSENMTKSLFTLTENKLTPSVAYYVAGYSPLEPSALQRYWLNSARSVWKRWPKQSLRRTLEYLKLIDLTPPPLKVKHVACVSQYEQQHTVNTGVPMDNTTVVYNGIDLAQFSFIGLPSSRRAPNSPLRLLYAGRLTWDKGAHVILQALRYLVYDPGIEDLKLVVLGKGDPQYTSHLQRMTLDYNLTSRVSFFDWIPRSEIAAFMADFDVLVLPTIHDEPLARIVQEAMALGLVVIGTLTGGTPEILYPEETGLSFAPDDSRGLVDQILRVRADLDFCDGMVRAARNLIEERFTIECTVFQIEALLYKWTQEDQK